MAEAEVPKLLYAEIGIHVLTLEKLPDLLRIVGVLPIGEGRRRSGGGFGTLGILAVLAVAAMAGNVLVGRRRRTRR